MKKFPHIISKLFYEPLLITRARHAAICQVVESHMEKVANYEPDSNEDQPEPDYQEVYDTSIIPVRGVLTRHAADIPMSSCGCGLDTVEAMIDNAMEDSNIKRLIFDFNTPGGAVTGIPELAARIGNISSKETIAFTDDECCSGGIWLATQTQKFYTTASASVGSIGVWTAYLDLTRMMEQKGIRMQSIQAGEYKLMGAYWKPLSKEEIGILQKEIDAIHADFKAAVNSRRNVDNQFMEGQIFDGEQASEIGLTDGIIDSISDLVDLPT